MAVEVSRTQLAEDFGKLGIKPGDAVLVHSALRTVGRGLMRNHLKHCTTNAVAHGSPDQAEAMYDELIELIYKYSR